MTDRQENKLSSHSALDQTLTTHTALWTPITAMAAAVGDFRDRLAALRALSQQQATAITGTTGQKNAARRLMESAAYRVSGPVAAFAARTGNQVLYAQVNIPRSDYTRARDEAVDDLGAIILDAATANQAALTAGYGLTAAKIADLDAALEAYQLLLGKPRSAIAARSTVTQNLDSAFGFIDELLETQLDQFARLWFEDATTTFYSDYINARAIADTGSRSNGEEEPPAPEPQP